MKDQEFTPTAAMKIYAYQRGILGEKASEKTVAKKVGIAAETISRWKQINGFLDWLEGQVAELRTPIFEVLEMVARSKLVDFRYWEAMANKFGYIGDAQGNSSPTVIRLMYSLDEKKSPAAPLPAINDDL